MSPVDASLAKITRFKRTMVSGSLVSNARVYRDVCARVCVCVSIDASITHNDAFDGSSLNQSFFFSV